MRTIGIRMLGLAGCLLAASFMLELAPAADARVCQWGSGPCGYACKAQGNGCISCSGGGNNINNGQSGNNQADNNSPPCGLIQTSTPNTPGACTGGCATPTNNKCGSGFVASC